MARMAFPRRLSPLLLGGGVLVIALGFGLTSILPSKSESTETTTPAVVEKSSSPDSSPPALGMSLARLAGSLVLVCGLCVLTTRWLQRKSTVQAGSMKVEAAMRLNSRCVVQLVQAGERRLLLGMDASGVKTLLELPPRQMVEHSETTEFDVIPLVFPAARQSA